MKPIKQWDWFNLVSLGIACSLYVGLLWLSHSLLPFADTSTRSGPWIYGPTDAKFTIVEYADLECPYCKQYTPWLKHWVSQQPNVNLQWHHLPLDIHGPTAVHAARLVECAGMAGGSEAFWQAVDLVFAGATGSGQGPRSTVQLPGNAKGQLDKCAAEDQVAQGAVLKDVAEARAKLISATPTLEIRNNNTGKAVRVEGLVEADKLQSALDWVVPHPNP